MYSRYHKNMLAQYGEIILRSIKLRRWIPVEIGCLQLVLALMDSMGEREVRNLNTIYNN